MERVRYLVIGAGITGLAFADRLAGSDLLVCEASSEVGGYCRSVHQDGFVWDYSGHFFHFRHPEIKAYLVDRMPEGATIDVERESRIFFADRLIDFPFQHNIHQLPREEFLDCLVDLFDRPALEAKSFEAMLFSRLGKGICERFLIPYNEKLYATALSNLDPDAMGRFFPHADPIEIVRGFRAETQRGYNTTFTYPLGGAIEYIRALATGIDAKQIRLQTRIESIDVAAKVAHTERGPVAYQHLVSTAPFDRLLAMIGHEVDRHVYSANQVEVFNLGFDRKGMEGVHWIYFPQRELAFYRVGFYDNVSGGDRMSLYVEIGHPMGTHHDDSTRETMRRRVLDDLRRVGIIDEHRLVAEHHIVLDPAYVHISSASNEQVARHRRALAEQSIHSIGRYGAWTYCSIEDNLLEAHALAAELEREG